MKTMTNTVKYQKNSGEMREECVEAIKTKILSLKTLTMIHLRLFWANGNYQYYDNLTKFQKEPKFKKKSEFFLNLGKLVLSRS